jgi:hypothetical protein
MFLASENFRHAVDFRPRESTREKRKMRRCTSAAVGKVLEAHAGAIVEEQDNDQEKTLP